MDTHPPAGDESALAVAITGSGGSGAVTTGLILLSAVARAGYYGLLTRSAGPQIRGGESAAMVRFAPGEVTCMGDRFDVFVALDWHNVSRFVDEIRLDAASLIVADPAAGPVPEILARSGAQVREVALQALADAIPEGRLNMVALGALGAATGLPLAALEASVEQTLGHKRNSGPLVAGSIACIRAGYAAAPAAPAVLPPPRPSRAGTSAATRRPVWGPCAGGCALSPPTPSPRPRRCWSGWPRAWSVWAGPCSRPRTNWLRST